MAKTHISGGHIYRGPVIWQLELFGAQIMGGGLQTGLSACGEQRGVPKLIHWQNFVQKHYYSSH